MFYQRTSKFTIIRGSFFTTLDLVPERWKAFSLRRVLGRVETSGAARRGRAVDVGTSPNVRDKRVQGKVRDDAVEDSCQCSLYAVFGSRPWDETISEETQGRTEETVDTEHVSRVELSLCSNELVERHVVRLYSDSDCSVQRQETDRRSTEKDETLQRAVIEDDDEERLSTLKERDHVRVRT